MSRPREAKRVSYEDRLRSAHNSRPRRTRRLAPGVIFLSLLMVLGTFLFVVMPPAAYASGPSPDLCY
ncbi:MAG: hypothetical protein WBE40_03860, partial [Thermoplasmata archaeon]